MVSIHERAALPTRVERMDAARTLYGPEVEALVGWLGVQDPLADAWVAQMAELGPGEGWRMTTPALASGRVAPGAPQALRALVDQLWDVPRWVEPARLDRGGQPLLRSGVLGGMVLGLRSLVVGYAAPGGNKPLVLSGMLERQTARRLQETTKFVQAVSVPGGMARGADGFVITARVRLMHAQVRRLVRASGRWDDSAWGAPINQHDMIATILLFSTVLLEGLERLGVRVDPQEAEEAVHLWRYVGHIIGLDEELGPRDLAMALRQQDMIDATQGAPDDDARSLTRALLTPPPGVSPSPRRAAIIHGLFRVLNGDPLADALAVPQSPWADRIRALRPMISAVDGARAQTSLADRMARQLGALYWEQIVSITTGDQPVSFAPPQKLGAMLSER